MWDYICPKCRREVKPNSHQCPSCGERFPFPLRVPPRCLKDQKALEDYVHKHIFPRISASQREYLAQFFTTIFSDGFESGDFSAWSGTVVTSGQLLEVISTLPHHGTYHLHAKTTASGVQAYAYKTFTATNIVYSRAYIRILNEWTNGDVWILQHKAGTTNIHGLAVTYSSGLKWRIKWYNGATVNYETEATGPAINTWYCIEIYSYIHASAGEATFWIDGNQLVTKTGLDSDNFGNVSQTGLGIMYTSVGGTVELYADCAVVADTYIGPEAAGQLHEIFVDAVTQLIATPAEQCMFNIVKDAAIAPQVTSLNFEIDIPKDAVTEVFTLHSEEATYNVIKDAITQTLATALFETGIFKYAIAQAMATPNIEIIFTIPKDAIVRTLTDSTIQSIFNLSQEAVVKVLAEANVIKEGEVKITKLFLILGNLAIQIQG
jgi:hypothetical protein